METCREQGSHGLGLYIPRGLMQSLTKKPDPRGQLPLSANFPRSKANRCGKAGVTNGELAKARSRPPAFK